MKSVALVAAALMTLILSGCGSNSGNQPTSTAVVPNACGTGVPSGYCTSYSPYSYPYSPYGASGYGNNGSGYYLPGSYGNYGYGAYGCPPGSAPIFNGGTTSCISTSYMSGVYGSSAYSGYGIYYPSNYTWPNGATGFGPGYSCDAYTNNCPGGSICIAGLGTRYGYCSVRNGL